MTAPGAFRRTDRPPAGLHVAVCTSNGRISGARVIRASFVRAQVDLPAQGACLDTPNASWDGALARLGYPRLGEWLLDAGRQRWYADVDDLDTPADRAEQVAPPYVPRHRPGLSGLATTLAVLSYMFAAAVVASAAAMPVTGDEAGWLPYLVVGAVGWWVTFLPSSLIRDSLHAAAEEKADA